MAASPAPKLFGPPHQMTFLITISLFISTSPIMISSQSHNTYIIHMDLDAMPKPYTDHHNWFAATLSTMPSPSTHLYTFTNSIHGFAAKLTLPQLHRIKSLPGYIHSVQDRQLHLHTTQSPKFLGLDSLAETFPATNHGRDVIIGFVDTGVWPESDSFRDDGMSKIPSSWKGKCVSGTQFNSSLCNKKLIGAYFYNKGLLASLGGNVSVAMNSPRDTDGHGTHTSSTAAGNYVNRASYFGYAPGTAKGVAPRARVSVYKAAWELGTFASDVIAAVDQAIQDRVDVLSMPLGEPLSDETLVEEVTSVATFAAVERGIFVVASAGNSGPQYATVINGAPWLTTVGAGSIDRRLGGVLRLGNGKKNTRTVPFLSLYAGNFSSKATAMVFLDGCTSIEDMVKNRDKIIVCKDNSTIGTQTQNENAREANATVVFITAMEVPFYYMLNFIPAAYVNMEDGKIVTDYFKSSKTPTGSLTFRKTTIGSKPDPRIDEFSGKGPLPSCPSVLKPDVIAPGSFILASWSPTSSVVEVRRPTFGPVFSPFKIMSGTSMAAAHVAGVAALIKNVHPDWSPAAIRSALMTTASTVDNVGEQIRDASNYTNPADPFGFGSGHIEPIKALDPGLVYDANTTDYVRLLCAMNFTASEIRVITRSSAHKCVGKSKVVDLNYPSFVAYFNDFGPGSEPRKVVYEFRRSVTNVGDGVASYTAKLTPMRGVAVKVEPKRLAFKRKYEKLSYKVTVEGPKLLSEFVVQGSLSWVHDGGKYVVRSPIVATNLVPVSPFSGQ